MQETKPLIKVLLKQIASVYLIYTICRLLFYVLNKNYFQDLALTDFFSILFFGLRFDSFSIATTNSLFILLSLLTFKFYSSKIYQGILKAVFIIPNSIAILLNIIDFAYFPYTQKRTTLDVLNLTIGGQSEITKLIPIFLVDFWYLIIIYAILIWLLIKLYTLSKSSQKDFTGTVTTSKLIKHIGISLVIVFATFIGIRGGFQKIPIVLLDAALYAKPQYIPVLINTPFSILKSADSEEMRPVKFMDDASAKKYVNTIHLADTGKFKQTNVCVIILESFSKEFTGIGNKKSYTPFLDSLMSKSLVFTNAYANGKTSIDGIPAIVASMPSYMNTPYLNSNYSNNNIQTLPNLLKDKGYNSSFFHGGTNGTMNFEAFSKNAGFDDYYGRTQYNNDDDYDGQWGIWDEPFLKYMVHKVSEFKEPFFTTVFTLSSHNPYKVPKQYEGKFPKGTSVIHECIGYTDYALKQFFAAARKTSWFKNTLFVITADHTSISDDVFYSNAVGQYSIPMLFYKENEFSGTSNKTIQQIDIMPSILDYLNYDKSYYSFGNSVFSSNKTTAIHFTSSYYCLVDDSLLYIIYQNKVTDVVNFKRDSTLLKSMMGTNKHKEDSMLNYTKAFIQTYTHDLNYNTTYLK